MKRTRITTSAITSSRLTKPPMAPTVPSAHSTSSTITTVQSNRSPLSAMGSPPQAGAHEQGPADDGDSTDPRRDRTSCLNGSPHVANLNDVLLRAVVQTAEDDEGAQG